MRQSGIPPRPRMGPASAVARIAAAAALALAGSCGDQSGGPAPRPASPPEARAGRFDRERAFDNLRRIVQCGPRSPGSKGSAMARDLFLQEFGSLGAGIIVQDFKVVDPEEGAEYAMCNLIFRFRPGPGPRILLGTHYDTRRYADLDPNPERRRDPVPGANDGGSGAAVLMEIGRIASADPPPCGIDIVFFDGEDFGRPGNDMYCQGSRRFCGSPPYAAQGNTVAAVIIDMVGDRNLEVFREGISCDHSKVLVDEVWKAAARAGAAAVFRDEVRYRISDDHVPLHDVLGIDSVLVIDFDYAGYFHTTSDTIDRCSAQSLGLVGETLAEFVYGRRPGDGR